MNYLLGLLCLRLMVLWLLSLRLMVLRSRFFFLQSRFYVTIQNCFLKHRGTRFQRLQHLQLVFFYTIGCHVPFAPDTTTAEPDILLTHDYFYLHTLPFIFICYIIVINSINMNIHFFTYLFCMLCTHLLQGHSVPTKRRPYSHRKILV